MLFSLKKKVFCSCFVAIMSSIFCLVPGLFPPLVLLLHLSVLFSVVPAGGDAFLGGSGDPRLSIQRRGTNGFRGTSEWIHMPGGVFCGGFVCLFVLPLQDDFFVGEGP